ncbi:hypothetical protein [Prescottella agglutinans]
MLADRSDPREVVIDPRARYFWAVLERDSLLPASGAQLAQTRLSARLSRQ